MQASAEALQGEGMGEGLNSRMTAHGRPSYYRTLIALRVCMDSFLFGTLTLAKAGLSYRSSDLIQQICLNTFLCVRRTGG